jgi:hypothetical protein
MAATGQALLVLGWPAVSTAWAGPDQQPKPLPEKVVQTWLAAGAEVGWLRPDPSGYLKRATGADVGWRRVEDSFGYLMFVKADYGKAGYVAAFRFSDFEKRDLAKLPDPGQPFGLDLGRSDVSDEGLKGLAELKSLQSLDLGFNLSLTDEGLKELAGLKNLQSLDLGANLSLTNAALKQLAGLKNLHSLNLGITYVSDVGLKELAGLKSLQSLNLSNTQVTAAGLRAYPNNPELLGFLGAAALHPWTAALVRKPSHGRRCCRH